jgi:nitrate/nitrite transporter NarK
MLDPRNQSPGGAHVTASKEHPKSNSIRHTLTMVILCLSGGTIYNVVYLFEVYYIPTQTALDLSKSEMGMLMGVFGAVSLLCYAPGGWLADRFSSRKLITLAMIITGSSGFYYATFPSYEVALALHALWGMSIALIFWNAMIRATRNWAPSDQQGRAFGFLEAGRGLASVIPGSILLGVFAWMGSTQMALATVISTWSAIIVLCGVAAWFVLEDDVPSRAEQSAGTQSGPGWKAVVEVLKMPAVWLIAIIIISANTAFWATYYFTPYATEVFLLTVAGAGMLSIGRIWLNPLAPLASGFIADRFGISNFAIVLLLVMTVSFGLFAVTPANGSLLHLVVLNGAIAALCIYGLRGIYFAMLDEQRVPTAVTGTAAGVASVIGFLPDIYMPILAGNILDSYPGLPGYRLLFGGACFASGLGVLAAWMLIRNRRRQLPLEQSPAGRAPTGAI